MDIYCFTVWLVFAAEISSKSTSEIGKIKGGLAW